MAEPVRVRRLTDQEGQKLQQIVRRGSTSSVRYRRAMMLLASAGGNRVPVIAQLVQAGEDTVRDVIHRFNEIGLTLGGREAVPACSALTTKTSSSRRPPPAPPSSASPSLAGHCASSPPACGKSTAASSASAARHYAAYSLAAASPSSAPRRGRSPGTPSARRNWTASRKCMTASRTGSSPSTSSGRSGSGPPPGHAGPSRAGPSGTPRPTTALTGCATSTGCYSVGDDRLWGVNRRKKGAVNTLAALKSIRAARPDGAPVYVTLDNLSAHKGADIRRWVKRHKVELCFTPTYASWANPIEAQFGPLRQFTIANSNHPNHTLQTRALHAYLRWRNANARHRDVLAAERKERAPIRSEKVIRWGGRPLKAVA